MTYYNTTGLFGQDLTAEIENATTQKEAILAIYKSKRKPMTPEQCQLRYSKVLSKPISLNSVRRAISDLTKEGLLEKTNEFGFGQWGKKVHKWKLAS